MSKAALGLKRLRERTKMSVREVAKALEKPVSTYASYEDKYKKPYLPVALVKDLLPIFTDKGVERGELLELAGVEDAYSEPASAESGSTDQSQPDHSMARIDELDVAVSAGAGATAEDTTVLRTWVMPRNMVSVATEAPAEHIKILRVKGDSMLPTYQPLDRLMVDTDDRSPSPGGVFVVWDGLAVVVKRVQLVPHSDPLRVKITSDNPRYEPYERTLDEAHIQGRVIGKWLWT